MVDKTAIKDLLIQICTNPKKLSDLQFQENMLFFMSNGVAVKLEGEDLQRYHKIIEEFYNDSFIKENSPRTFIEKKIKNIISETLARPNDKREEHIGKSIDDFNKYLKTEIKTYVFFIPIENLLVNRKFTVGDVDIYSYQVTGKIFKSKFYEIQQSNPNYTRKEKEKLINDQLKAIKGRIKNRPISFAMVSCTGIYETAKQRALWKVRVALNTIKLVTFPKFIENGSNFAPAGDLISPNFINLLSYSTDNSGLKFDNDRVGYIRPFNLSHSSQIISDKASFRYISSILSKPNIPKFEKNITTAIFWFGEAHKQESLMEMGKKGEGKNGTETVQQYNVNKRFLFLFIALEAILVSNENEPITNNISERIAFLLFDDFALRKRLKAYMKKLYGKRSKIVHNGWDDISIDDVNNLSYITRNLILKLVKLKEKNSWEKQSDMFTYIEEIKLS